MNPWFLCYQSTARVLEYAGPSAIFVTGRSNRGDPAFQIARQMGAEVLGYLNFAETRNQRVSQPNEDFYMGNSAAVPRWLGPDGAPRGNYVENGVTVTQLLDIRPGSLWVNFAIDFLCERMEDGQLDGVFLDVLGGKLWGGSSGFNTWSAAERKAWQDANVALVQRLDYERRRRNPGFIILNNNTWQQNLPGEPMRIGTAGEQCVDGVCLEGHDPATNAFVATYAGRQFGDLGHRRVLTISKSKDAALRWAALPGVTHVCAVDQDGDGKSDYGAASPPVVPNDVRLRLDELRAYADRLKAEAAALGSAVLNRDERIATLQSSLTVLDGELLDAQTRISRAAAELGYEEPVS